MNADWVGCSDNRRSTDGFAIYLVPNLILWSSRKQTMAPCSTTKVEYKALTNDMAKAIWTLVFVEGAWHTSVHSSCFCGVIILEPHMSSILVFMPVPCILKLIFTTLLHVCFIAPGDQIADVFTKPVTQLILRRFCSNLNFGHDGLD
jgi:hypothetical protein